MPSTYTGNLGIELPADGELDGVWGDVVNDNMNIIDRAINGSLALALSGTSSTLTTSDGSLSDGQYKLLVLGGTPSGTHTITIAPSNAQKIYFVRNTTAQSVVFTQGSGGNVTVATGDSAIIYSDGAGAGAAVVNITNDFAMNSVKITGGTIDGAVVGGTTPAAGTFTTANATTVDTTNIEVTTLKAKDGTSAGSIADSTGVVTLASSVLTTTDINGGTIDGAIVGGTTPAAGTFTTANATTVDTTNIEVTTLKAKDGTSAGSIADSTGVVTLASSVLTTTDINGGTIDGAVVGGTTPAAGTFTTANATTVDTTNIEVTTLKAKDGTSAGSIADSTGVVTLASSVLTTTDINGGTIDGTAIGGSSAAAGTFTTVDASGVASFADGTAALPSITNTGDTNTGILFPAADTVAVSTAGTERMRVDSSGNVGIGGTPATQLDLAANNTAGTALNVLRFTDTDLSATGPQELGKIEFYSADNSAPGAGVKASITGIAEVGNPGGGIAFSTDLLTGTPIERMRIDRNGNVGIGTTSPTNKLDVNGNIGLPAATTETRGIEIGVGRTGNGNTFIDFIGDATYTDYGLRIIRAAGVNAASTMTHRGTGNLQIITEDAAALTFQTSLTERMRIDSSGNLGIGTSSPLAKVHSQVNTFTTADMVAYKAYNAQGVGVYANFQNTTTGTAITDGFLIGINDSEEAVLVNYEATAMAFSTNATERMRIDASGNVGIGVTPSAWSWGGRVIDGTNNMVISAGGNNLTLSANTYWNGTAWAYKTTSQASYYTQLASQHQWLTAPSGTAGTAVTFTQAMTLDAGGNLGIGTTSPVAKLHVTGALITTGVTYLAQPAQTSKAAAATLTIAELLTGIVQYTGAAATLTLPTGTLIEGGLPATFPTDMSFDVSFINTGAALLTIGTATNLTLVGTMTVATLTSAMLRFRKTATNTYTVYRIS